MNLFVTLEYIYIENVKLQVLATEVASNICQEAIFIENLHNSQLGHHRDPETMGPQAPSNFSSSLNGYRFLLLLYDPWE